ncbi:hypothetical protein PFFVO_00278 [Plasmodium falciparum Vietnam Oak-Knoll (FVO)]|uniref:Uncharacterized protein n=1 Tax=Plasmodium falciparum Vietnam Oak-Knoll (FVO) TaxID=1036723 RepID=A0A024VDP6_PLAFA|nr:hypothetical protein PFFVO_00278 [Plasmodium falciparum Vietnam Oak-Knoll (FVO)]
MFFFFFFIHLIRLIHLIHLIHVIVILIYPSINILEVEILDTLFIFDNTPGSSILPLLLNVYSSTDNGLWFWGP